MHLGDIGGVEELLHSYSTLALDGGELSDSLPSCFIPREKVPSTIEEETEWSLELV